MYAQRIFQTLNQHLEQTVALTDADHLLQEADLIRLKAVVYRDMVRNRYYSCLCKI